MLLKCSPTIHPLSQEVPYLFEHLAYICASACLVPSQEQLVSVDKKHSARLAALVIAQEP